MVGAVLVDAQGAQRNLRRDQDQGGEQALPLLGSGRGQLCVPWLLQEGLWRQQGGPTPHWMSIYGGGCTPARGWGWIR